MATYEGIRIYAAGKITKNGWRHRLFPIADDHDYTGTYPSWPDGLAIDDLPGAVYVGPHFLSCDHGCFHGENTHGVAGQGCGGEGLSRPDVLKRCLTAIEHATHVFAWIDKADAYGSLVELGYARALGKHIHLYLAEDLDVADDLWFAAQASAVYSTAKTATHAWEDFAARLPAPLVLG
ncbi:hypothetical protein ACFORH_10855 [Amycolatopsis roodepoortensis]|uniref:Uncharacterized protein n=1 Tax=Amycolatopsis roodepoortensis TaxID=700274 RepID=A0ABR9LAG7_9PSEU|nr:hypothetical protein [Amycolatopsis roodepoortensis]MBE1577679.1 hypothetical protein [Amycolatopsis roodepoortensis]